MKRTFLLVATILAPLAAAPVAAFAQPVTGLYIGAAGGGNFLQQERASTYVLYKTSKSYSSFGLPFDAGAVGVASVGYGLGNGLRFEVEGNYRYNAYKGSSIFHEQKYGAMANVLFDLDIGSSYVFPYIGGGAGYARVEQNGGYFGKASEGSFAYQAIAGLSLPIPPVVGLSLTAEYRFYALAGDRFHESFLSGPSSAPTYVHSSSTDNYNHSLLIGLKYAFNVAPPPVSAPPPAPPGPTLSRAYLIFFDWDRADLSDRARQIIAAAAQASTRIQVTRIEVTGNTDTTGTAAYNLGLSRRRAEAVAAELVRNGVPRTAITTQGAGFGNLLVPTGPGVREPQNRRVEIALR